MAGLHQGICDTIDGLRETLERVAREIHLHPELRFEERFAAALLAEELSRVGLKVERGVGNLETALKAEFGAEVGPCVAILAEYDALPNIGHACGHNLIAAGALGATLGLHAMGDALPGRVRFIGTPAEEGGGGKITLLEAGAFDAVDAAMMFHPLDQDLLWMPALACDELQFDFSGRASHAAAAPWDGRSALTAVIQTFNLVDAARVHWRDGTRVHGFIHDGGEAVNIIPSHAGCQFSVRAREAEYLDVVRAKVINCAHAAASATGTEVEVTVRTGYRDIRNNRPMFTRFGEHLTELGGSPGEPAADHGVGSTDMGDVSHVTASIHPYVAICGKGETTCHQHAFARASSSDEGMEAMVRAAKAMACTTWDLLNDPELFAQTRQVFEAGQAP